MSIIFDLPSTTDTVSVVALDFYMNAWNMVSNFWLKSSVSARIKLRTDVYTDALGL